MNQIFRHLLSARFQDIDGAGILFFGRNFDYFHDAYVAFLEALGTPLRQNLENEDYLIPLVHAEADFAAPIRFGDRCDVQIRVARLGTSSYTLSYTLVGEQQQVLTRGQTVHCCVDRKTFASCPLPERLKTALTPYVAATSP